MRFRLLGVLFFGVAGLISAVGNAQQGCIGAGGLERKVVHLSRMYQPDAGSPKFVLAGGSGWFHLYDNEVLTNAHVVKEAMRISSGQTVEIRIRQHSVDNLTIQEVHMDAFVLDIDEHHDIARLKLERPYFGAQLLPVRTGLLTPGETIQVAGYARSLFTVGRGYVATLQEQAALQRRGWNATFYAQDHLPISVQRKEDLNAFFPGSSGSPFFDCHGMVVGMAKLMQKKCYVAVNLSGKMCTDTEIEDVQMPNIFGARVRHIFDLYARGR